MPKCPDIAHCPLYAASHHGVGYGCVDDMAIPCLVERGSNRWKMLRDGLEKAIAQRDTDMAAAMFVALARTAGEPA